MLEISATSNDAIVLTTESQTNGLKQHNGPVNTDFLEHDDSLGKDDRSSEKSIPPEQVRVTDRRARQTSHDEKITLARSLSPVRRNPYAPPPDLGPFRRCQSATHQGPTRPDRAFSGSSTSVVKETTLQLLEMVGIPLEEEEAPNKDDNYDDYKVSDSEIQTLVNDHDEFLRLKSALKAKGAVTNEMLRQRLHVYVHRNRVRIQSSTHHRSSTSPRDSECSQNSSSSSSSLWFGMTG